MKYCTLAEHAYHPKKPDKIYAMNQAAQAAAEKDGPDAVINATLGNCIDDAGKAMILPTVDRLFRQLPSTELYSYAPITGVEGFTQAVATSLFGDWRPNCHFRAIPTPGGCGALRHLVWNFLDSGEPLLSSDWCWNPYRNICEEHGRLFTTFQLFTKQGTFNHSAFAAAVEEQLKNHDALVVLLNTPGHNPTGYRITPDEMEQIAAIIRENAVRSGKRITVCLDFSYIDYALLEREAQKMVECFQAMPENTMLTAVFSMSKSFTMPGIRCGALAAFAQTEEAAEEFQNTMAYSSRSVWSNTVRPAQRVLVDICEDPRLFKAAGEERRIFAETIVRRGERFMAEAAYRGLACCPYSSGFFVSVPCREPATLAQELMAQNVFVVPLQQGIRVSVCSTHTDKCVRAAAIIAETCHRLNL